MSIQIEPEHLHIVRNLLSQYKYEFHVFGSRTKGTARVLSDLDILVQGGISKSDLEILREQFEESDLPFNVDLIRYEDMDSQFFSHICDGLQKIVLE